MLASIFSILLLGPDLLDTQTAADADFDGSGKVELRNHWMPDTVCLQQTYLALANRRLHAKCRWFWLGSGSDPLESLSVTFWLLPGGPENASG